MCIALPAPATGSDHNLFAGHPQIADQLSRPGVADHRADWYLDYTIFAAPPVAILAHSVLAAVGFVLLLVAQVEQCRKLRIRNCDHVPAVAAVSTIRTTARNVFLPPKADAAASPVTRDDADFYFIDELHQKTIIPLMRAKKKPREGLFVAARKLIEARR